MNELTNSFERIDKIQELEMNAINAVRKINRVSNETNQRELTLEAIKAIQALRDLAYELDELLYDKELESMGNKPKEIKLFEFMQKGERVGA